MKLSAAHIVRFLQNRGRTLAYVRERVASELALGACRALERGAKLERNVVYVAVADDLPKSLRLPSGSALVTAGNVPARTRIEGWYASVAEISFGQLLNDVLELFQAFSEFDAGLHVALEEDASMQDLVDLATPLFGNEILLMDSRLKMIAQSYERIALYDVSGIDQLDENNYAPAEVFDFFQNDTVFQAAEKAREPFYYDPSVFSVRVYCINILAQGEYASRLILCETAREIEPCDERLFEYFATFVQKLYDQNMMEPNPNDDLLVSVVEDLLDNVSVLPTRIESAYEQRGWSRDDMLVCACIAPAGYGSHEKTLPLLCRRISRDFPETCALVREKSIALLANLSEYAGKPEPFFTSMSIMQRESNLRIGQSPPFQSVEEVGGRFAQAKAALEISHDLDLQQWRNTFTSLRLEYLARALESSIEARILVAEEIERLMRYDDAHGTAYVDTLAAFLEAGMNTQSAARGLFVHRATMIYRLKRIREIGGIDFDNREQMLYVHLSLKVLMRKTSDPLA